MSDLNFDERMWSATVSHNTPETPGIWGIVINADTEDEAIKAVVEAFESQGLNPVRITRIEIEELLTAMGGDNGG